MRPAHRCPPRIGDLWRHKRTNAIYTVIGRDMIKTPEGWAPTVTYTRTDESDARRWIRTLPDFSGAFQLHAAQQA